MRRTERLFHLVERLRSAKNPITAAELSQELEVSERTIYRDIKLLILQGLPISGEAGVGYLMDSGFNAPALQFTHDELEILSIGLRFVFRDGDNAMRRSAETVLSKIQAGMKSGADFDSIDLYAVGDLTPPAPFLTKVRHAIRNRSIIEIDYQRIDGEQTQRKVKPLALLFFNQATLIAGYCELRKDFRYFRADLVQKLKETGDTFEKEHFKLRRRFFDQVKREQTKQAGAR